MFNVDEQDGVMNRNSMNNHTVSNGCWQEEQLQAGEPHLNLDGVGQAPLCGISSFCLLACVGNVQCHLACELQRW